MYITAPVCWYGKLIFMLGSTSSDSDEEPMTEGFELNTLSLQPSRLLHLGLRNYVINGGSLYDDMNEPPLITHSKHIYNFCTVTLPGNDNFPK